ncbi:tRNA adenosine(34) deaminase TadA [Cernens ardua]|uniref:tRNA adenosine(34) deaminase TadA n=1 Tax=Cernens ardua TaxID=3402176 RepID=UPI003F98A8AF
MRSDDFYMHRALEQAHLAAEQGEVPVGAVVVNSAGDIIGRGFNQPIGAGDPSAHAEIIAMRQAAEYLDNYRLLGCTLYVTLEPCMMCLGAVINARLARIVYAAPEPKTGMIESRANLLMQPWHSQVPAVTGGVLASRSKRLLRDFFAYKRGHGDTATSEDSD